MSGLKSSSIRDLSAVLASLLLVSPAWLQAQPEPTHVDIPDLSQPLVFKTFEVPQVRVVPVTLELSRPWSMAFRGNGDILITERDAGALRIVRDGVLLDEPVAGVPLSANTNQYTGLMEVALHPEDDSLVYLTYTKLLPGAEEPVSTVALARGRLVEDVLLEVEELYVAKADVGAAAARLRFAPDGTLIMTLGGAINSTSTGLFAQDPATSAGKVLRFNADGSIPPDNPFVGNPAFLPEIYSLGHRNQLGLAIHPETGEIWATENAPQGGDEANIIRAGANYGWPVASYAREYRGDWVSQAPWQQEFAPPQIIWWPSIAPSGMEFYTGDKFPEWQGNLFVGSLRVGRIPGTGHLERFVFNSRGEEIRREYLFNELHQRIRDVRQSPDGYLYLLTEEARAGLFRVEPVTP